MARRLILASLYSCRLISPVLRSAPKKASFTSSAMSWMDSWSRPSKTQAVPAPYYLLPGGESTPYCHTCGRVISSRRSKERTDGNIVKYCSKRCRSNKPGKLELTIEHTFVRLLNGLDSKQHDNQRHKKSKKSTGSRSDTRILVPCSLVQNMVFGEPEQASTGELPPTDTDPEDKPRSSEDRDADDVDPSGIDLGATATVTEESKRKQGQVAAHRRETVKQAARRGVVFGFVHADELLATGKPQPPLDGKQGARKKCEAVMSGNVVEPSFAKGDWAVRWRE